MSAPIPAPDTTRLRCPVPPAVLRSRTALRKRSGVTGQVAGDRQERTARDVAVAPRTRNTDCASLLAGEVPRQRAAGVVSGRWWLAELPDSRTVSDARLILTCGLPGAGKTTLATQLAAERSAVRLTKDEWLWALGSSPWDRPTGEKIEQELWRLAPIPFS